MARAIEKKVPVKFKGGRKGACVLYDDGLIRIDGVRFSYPHLKKPYAGDGDGEAKFGVVGLLPKKGNEAAKKLIDTRIAKLLKENKVKALASDKKFVRDGDESGKEEYEGHWTISARETRKPPLRNSSGETVEPDDVEDLFQPGYWGSILIRPWYQNNSYGKRVNAGLSSVQVICEDETFGEGRISDEELDDIYESWDDDGDFDDDDDDDEIDI
ncbi:MAG: hypothetical protein CMF19_08430 [Idiomarinaceae bacterium]|nr:hypothetical protein [Idiomarinaceae bacterium]